MMKLNLQLFAHKKGMGSTRNGRDSESKRLGPKRADGQFSQAGNILVRQRGTKIHPGSRANYSAFRISFRRFPCVSSVLPLKNSRRLNPR